ncbi:MAG: sigma-70 family RNA polymerase sigma factor [Ilumatobacteraceae bacterium]
MDGYRGVDEHQLVDLARTDSQAFAELYRRNVQALHAFAQRRTGSKDDADDITAVTFERAMRNLHRYRASEVGIVGWLYRIAANEIIDQARRRQRSRSPRAQRALRLVQPPSPPVPGDSMTGDPRLIAALDRLNERYQTVLSLRFIAGLSPAEVAAQLDISEGNCAVLTHRALAALRTQLEKGDVDA